MEPAYSHPLQDDWPAPESRSDVVESCCVRAFARFAVAHGKEWSPIEYMRAMVGALKAHGEEARAAVDFYERVDIYGPNLDRPDVWCYLDDRQELRFFVKSVAVVALCPPAVVQTMAERLGCGREWQAWRGGAAAVESRACHAEIVSWLRLFVEERLMFLCYDDVREGLLASPELPDEFKTPLRPRLGREPRDRGGTLAEAVEIMDACLAFDAMSGFLGMMHGVERQCWCRQHSILVRSMR